MSSFWWGSPSEAEWKTCRSTPKCACSWRKSRMGFDCALLSSREWARKSLHRRSLCGTAVAAGFAYQAGGGHLVAFFQGKQLDALRRAARLANLAGVQAGGL